MIRLILLAVVLGAVWMLWQALSAQKSAGAKAAADDPTLPRPEEAAETAECPRCHAYVPIAAEDGCGREDCPIPDLAAAFAAEERATKGGEAEEKPG